MSNISNRSNRKLIHVAKESCSGCSCCFQPAKVGMLRVLCIAG